MAIVGLFFNLLLPIFGEYGFVKFGPIASLILVATSTYAIIRHQLFDIRLAAVRTIAYILALGTLAAIYYIFVYLASVVLLGGETQTSLSVSPVNIFLALFMAFIFQPVKKFLTALQTIFSSDTYKSDDFFARLSELLASSTELRGVFSNVWRLRLRQHSNRSKHFSSFTTQTALIIICRRVHLDIVVFLLLMRGCLMSIIKIWPSDSDGNAARKCQN